MKKFFTLVLSLLSLSAMAQFPTPTATTNSENLDAGMPATNVCDGNDGTRWASINDDGNDVWVLLDYGTSITFNTIRVRWEGANANSYKILLSNDGEGFKEVFQGGVATGDVFIDVSVEGEPVSYQYIMFKGIEKATGWGYSIWEINPILKGEDVLTTIEATFAKSAVIGTPIAPNSVVGKSQDNMTMDFEWTVEFVDPEAGTFDPATKKITFAKDGKVSFNIVEVTDKPNPVKKALSTVVCPANNLALSTDIVNDNKIYDQSDFIPSGTDAFHAVDDNDGSVWQGSPTNGTDGDEASRTYDCWFVVDLGAEYDLTSFYVDFEGACSQEYTIDGAVSYDGDDTEWKNVYEYEGAAGVNGHIDYEAVSATNIRFVRFKSTKAATQYGMKIYTFRVFGTLSSSTDVKANSADDNKPAIYKTIENNRIVIVKEGQRFDILGVPMK